MIQQLDEWSITFKGKRIAILIKLKLFHGYQETSNKILIQLWNRFLMNKKLQLVCI